MVSWGPLKPVGGYAPLPPVSSRGLVPPSMQVLTTKGISLRGTLSDQLYITWSGIHPTRIFGSARTVVKSQTVES